MYLVGSELSVSWGNQSGIEMHYQGIPMNRNKAIITFIDLCEFCTLSKPSEVITWCRVNDVPYILDANDNPCTTTNVLDEAVSRGKRTSSAIIDHEDLQAMTGLTQTRAMKKHLRKAGILCKEANGRLFITTDALTQAIMGRAMRLKRGPNFDSLRSAAKIPTN